MSALIDPREDTIAAALHDSDEQRHDIKWDERVKFSSWDEVSKEIEAHYRGKARIVLEALRREQECYRRFKAWEKREKEQRANAAEKIDD